MPSFFHLRRVTLLRILAFWFGVVASTPWAIFRASAQEPPPLTWSGQIRPRTETRTSQSGDAREVFTSMRVRAGLAAALDKEAKIFLQFQDVRLWGEEAHTLTDYRADNFDLHQGYLELTALPGLGGTLRVGRQELAFGEQRLVGAVDWTQQGRSFDGLRYTAPALGKLETDFFWMKTQEASSPTHRYDAAFLGAYGTLELEGGSSFDLYLLANTDSRQVDPNELVTFGGLWKGRLGALDARFEGSFQGGQWAGKDVSAYLVGGRVTMSVTEKAKVTFWYDLLSGDDNPNDGEWKVFNTLYATNHAFYGLADYFTDIPLHTGGLGLQDLALKLAVAPRSDTDLNVDLHVFRTAQPGELSSRSLLDELDLTLTHRLSERLRLVGGYSFVQVRDGIQELGRLNRNAHWAYLMLDGRF